MNRITVVKDESLQRPNVGNQPLVTAHETDLKRFCRVMRTGAKQSTTYLLSVSCLSCRNMLHTFIKCGAMIIYRSHKHGLRICQQHQTLATLALMETALRFLSYLITNSTCITFSVMPNSNNLLYVKQRDFGI